MKYLATYLADHYGASVAARELTDRMLDSNSGSEFEPGLRRFQEQLGEDAETLDTLMELLEVEPSAMKDAAAWLGEKLGRLKLNGHISSYSPLSRVEELEILICGVTGKICLWEALARVGPGDVDVDYEALLARAKNQRELLEDLHARAIKFAFSA